MGLPDLDLSFLFVLFRAFPDLLFRFLGEKKENKLEKGKKKKKNKDVFLSSEPLRFLGEKGKTIKKARNSLQKKKIGTG